MNIYIKLETLEYPRHPGDIRLEHPEIGEDFVCPSDYAEVQSTPPPDFISGEQYPFELPPTESNGVWVMNWAVHTYTQEEKDFLVYMQDPANRPVPSGILDDDEPDQNIVVQI